MENVGNKGGDLLGTSDGGTRQEKRGWNTFALGTESDTRSQRQSKGQCGGHGGIVVQK